MKRLLWGASAALLVGIFVQFCLPKLVYTFMVATQATPPASQKRSVPKHGPAVNGNLIRDELPVPAFTTDDQIDWLEKDFKHRPGDVWVTTYAKVGTTWTQNIVNLLNGHEPGGMVHIFKGCPWPEMNFTVFSTARDEVQKSAESASDTVRCFKSHWWNRDHMGIDKLPVTSKVIFVYRDAESVFTSYYHHILNKYGFYQVGDEDFPGGKSWEGLFELFMAGELDYGCYFKHTASWWQARDRPNVLMVRFDELKKQHVETIRKIAEFIGVSLNESKLEHVRHHSSFSEMKKQEEGDIMAEVLKWAGFFRGSHIRSGGAKEKTKFTAPQLARLQQRYEEVLEPLGMPRALILSHKLE